VTNRPKSPGEDNEKLNTLGIAPKLRQNRFKYRATIVAEMAVLNFPGLPVRNLVQFQWAEKFGWNL
jgi:hypothetical protein